MTCSRCGVENNEDSVFCVKCGAPLRQATVATPVAPGVPDPMLMRGPRVAVRRYAQGKNPFVALLISFVFPAGGQFYNADFKKAAAIWGAYILCVAMVFTGIGAPVAFVLSLAIWVFAIIDAYRAAKCETHLW